MNKSALKKFATTMRLELISLVKTKIDFLLSNAYKENLAKYNTNKVAIAQIDERYAKEKNDFIEEVAYTWFNRLVALRFMDVNEITASPIISTTDEHPIPKMFSDAKAGNIEDDLNLNRELFFDLIDKKVAGIKDSDNEAYKMLFIATCNHFSKLMPSMFERISDYTELLLPDDMLSPNSLRAKVVEAMSEEDCHDIEIIGWLYQFYISEKKDDVFAKLKKNQKITPSNIPAATQLFTPHWIVKYMVENSLGKLWMLNNPTSTLKEQMKYFIQSDEQTNEFIKVTTPEELTFLDPCCGSGHTLTYAFDLLTLIYEEQGYNKSDIPSLILQHNLFGCDIDKRASVLANFALTMKARQYHKRFFKKDVKPNIVELEDYDSEEFKGIKNFGSLLVGHAKSSFNDGIFGQNTQEYELQKKILSTEFHCVVTNPPYMGSKSMNKELSDFVKINYPNSSTDLMTCFMERSLSFTKKNGYSSMINIPSWMFLSSYEIMRQGLIDNIFISSLLHLGRGVFGSDFGTVAYVFKKSNINNANGIYRRLFIKQGLVDDVNQKESWFLDREFGYFKTNQKNFNNIPGFPFAYWVSDKIRKVFENSTPLKELYPPRTGMMTTDNNRFLRYWYEPRKDNIGFNLSSIESSVECKKKWFPYQKGGDFRKWYGNNDYIVNWKNAGREIIDNGMTSFRGKNFYFKEGITWSIFGFNSFGVRFSSQGSIFDIGGTSSFPDKTHLYYILSFLSSKITFMYLSIMNPTVNFQNGDISRLPIIFPISDDIKNQIDIATKQNIDISKKEWDSRETSWDFKENGLLRFAKEIASTSSRNDGGGVRHDGMDGKIESAYNAYCNYWREKFTTLHANEEELNRLFIDIYELQDELTPHVELKDITILKQESDIVDGKLVFDADEIMKQFVSYECNRNPRSKIHK